MCLTATTLTPCVSRVCFTCRQLKKGNHDLRATMVHRLTANETDPDFMVVPPPQGTLDTLAQVVLTRHHCNPDVILATTTTL